jgi:hypothetical protein
MVGSGMLKGLDVIFYMALIGVIMLALSGLYGAYKLWDYYNGDEEIISPHKIVPELKLTITENKVDTLYIYKLKK